VSHGRVCCDSGAQERRYSGEIEIGRDAKDKVLFDDDAVRVTTVGDTSKVHVRRVVGKSHVGAELLKTSLTFRAGTVGVNQAADRSKVARLEFGNCRADLGDTANYLMAWCAGIYGGHHAPLITDLMEVRVADTTKKDIDLNVVFARIAPRDHCWGKRRCCTCSGISLRVVLAT
jgi:hypothetical protein